MPWGEIVAVLAFVLIVAAFGATRFFAGIPDPPGEQPESD